MPWSLVTPVGSMYMVYTWHLPAHIFGESLGRGGLGTVVLESTRAQSVGSMLVYHSQQRFGAFEPWRRMVVMPLTVWQLFMFILRDGDAVEGLQLERMPQEVFHQTLFRVFHYDWYCVVWGQSMDRSHLNAYVHHPNYDDDTWDRYEAHVGIGAVQVPCRYREIHPKYINFAETLRMSGWEQPPPLSRL